MTTMAPGVREDRTSTYLVRRNGAPYPAIDLVAPELMAEFDGKLSAELVAGIVLGARKDLGCDVPPEALPEFTHRLARQRLVERQSA
jgi:hypothetical protein